MDLRSPKAPADKLTLDAMGKRMNEYRSAFDRVEVRPKSLVEQGKDDQRGIES
jgi:hypothetical protein